MSGDNGNGGDNSSGGSSGNPGGNGNPGVSGTGIPAKIPTTVITTLPKNLEDAVLTEADKQQKAAGADIRIELEVTVAPAGASAADRALVEKALNGSAAG